jgi:hypothetical protein
MTPMPPMGGGMLDPKLMMLLKSLGLDPSALGGAGAGAGGPGGAPLGAPPPGLAANLGPPGGPPGGPGAAGAFGPPGAGPSPGGAPINSPAPPPPPSPAGAAGAPGVTPPSPSNPQMDMNNMILGQAGYGGQERGLDRQMQMADELRKTATPGMRGAGGRVQTAANPLEFAAAGLDRVAGQRMSNDVAGQQKQMFEDRMKKLREDMAASRGVGGGGSPSTFDPGQL